eukprot:839995-Amphidinium_carterae.1
MLVLLQSLEAGARGGLLLKDTQDTQLKLPSCLRASFVQLHCDFFERSSEATLSMPSLIVLGESRSKLSIHFYIFHVFHARSFSVVLRQVENCLMHSNVQ